MTIWVWVFRLWYILFTTRWCASVQWVGRLENHLVLAPREISGEKSNMLAPGLAVMIQASQKNATLWQLVRWWCLFEPKSASQEHWHVVGWLVRSRSHLALQAAQRNQPHRPANSAPTTSIALTTIALSGNLIQTFLLTLRASRCVVFGKVTWMLEIGGLEVQKF